MTTPALQCQTTRTPSLDATTPSPIFHNENCCSRQDAGSSAWKTRYRFESWVNWVRVKCDRLGEVLEPMRKVAAMVERHLEGILAHWQAGLTTGFLEGLNSVFSAVKRKARGLQPGIYDHHALLRGWQTLYTHRLIPPEMLKNP